MSLSAEKDSRSAHTLKVCFVYLLVLAFLSALVSWRLVVWKRHLDSTPPQRYGSLSWSEDSRLAFLTQDGGSAEGEESAGGGQEAPGCTLYSTDCYAENVKKMQSELSPDSRILGWFQDPTFGTDKQHVVVLDKHDAQGFSLLVASADNKDHQFFNFPDGNLRVVCRDGNALICQRPYSDSTGRMCGVELVSWSLAAPHELVNLARVPSRENEFLSVQDARTSPDGKKVAVAICVEPLPEGKTAEAAFAALDFAPNFESVLGPVKPNTDSAGSAVADQADTGDNEENTQAETSVSEMSVAVPGEFETGSKALGIWLLDNETKALSWTTVSVEGVERMFLNWSLDGSRLLAVSWRPGTIQLVSVFNDNSSSSAEFSGNLVSGPMRPLMPTPQGEAYLVGSFRLIEYNFTEGMASALCDHYRLGYNIQGLAVTPSCTLGAFVKKSLGIQTLCTTTLPKLVPEPVDTREKSFKPSFLYGLAEVLEGAASFWKII